MKARGFTLIELLLVMVIVFLLAALLFPVLGGARRSAHAVTCLAGLSQLSSGWGALMVQDKGIIPNTTGGSADERWDTRTLLSMGIDPNSLVEPAVSCPTVLANYGPERTTAGKTTYGINVRWRPNEVAGDNTGQSFDALVRPSTYPLFGDTFINTTGTVPLIYDEIGVRPDQSWRLGFVHEGETANVAFADGHVEAVTQGVLTGPTDANGVPMWFFNVGVGSSLAHSPKEQQQTQAPESGGSG